jgi:hypothetical protein
LRRKIDDEEMETKRQEITVTCNAGVDDLPCGTGKTSNFIVGHNDYQRPWIAEENGGADEGEDAGLYEKVFGVWHYADMFRLNHILRRLRLLVGGKGADGVK